MALPSKKVRKSGALASPNSSVKRRQPPRAIRRKAKPGLTLIEMMVAMAVTLILMFAVLKIAAVIGESADTGRALLEVSGELRAASHLVQDDLDRFTTPAIAPIDPSTSGGYIEFVEGPMRDASSGTPNSVQGDVDDYLGGTIRASVEPFTGRYNGSVIQSNLAEVAYWTRFDATIDDENKNGAWDIGERRVLYRRVLLIRPDLNLGGAGNDIVTFQQNNDVSARMQGGGLAANSLADLTRRENRFCHVQNAFPYPLNWGRLANGAQLSGNAIGEDIVLSRVVAFDVRVWDPAAPLMPANPVALTPGDPAYDAGTANGAPGGRGAFVDLNYAGQNVSITNGGRISPFSGQPENKSGLANSPTYDTWSWHYETDGQQQYGVVADAATNGLDDDNNGLVDDPGERDTSPPYPVPLRGAQITIRVLESDSRQVRQASVVGDFTPQ